MFCQFWVSVVVILLFVIRPQCIVDRIDVVNLIFS